MLRKTLLPLLLLLLFVRSVEAQVHCIDNPTPCIFSGPTAPNGVVTESTGGLFMQTGTGTRLWRKNTGTGDTGWTAIPTFDDMTGTTGNLAKWTGTNTLGNSIITEDGMVIRVVGGSLVVDATATVGTAVLGSASLAAADSFTVSTAAGNLTLSPFGNVTIPSGKQLATSYSSGWSGTGYTLNYNSSFANEAFMEIDRLSVRGIMNVYELLVHQIRATNGSIFVSSTGKAKIVTDNGGGSYTVETETDHGFAVNDLIRAQRFTGTGVYQSDLTVTAVANSTQFTATLRATYTPPAAGMEYVRLGNTTDATRRASIYLTADDTNAPYINMLDGVSTFAEWGAEAKVRQRIGQMNGSYGFTSNLFGMGVGNPAATNVVVTDTLGFRIRFGTTDKFYADTSGNVFLAGTLNVTGAAYSGTTSGACGTGIGWRLDYNAGTPCFYVGTTAGSPAQYLHWTGAALLVSAADSIFQGTTTLHGSISIQQTAWTMLNNTVTGTIRIDATDTTTLGTAVKIETGAALSNATPSNHGLIIPRNNTPATCTDNLYSPSAGDLYFNCIAIALSASSNIFGSGTTNFLTMFTGTNGVGNSKMEEVRVGSDWVWVANRPATTNYAGFVYRTAGVSKWGLLARETGTGLHVYNYTLALNALSFADADSAATFAASVTAPTFVGALTGNSTTATALAANPADCAANQFANAIAASGTLTCAAIVDADVPNTITIDGTNNVTWASVNKTGSSLADLATRSAADLSSGTLPDARLSSNVPLLNAANVFAADGNNFTASLAGAYNVSIRNTASGAGSLTYLGFGNNSSVDIAALRLNASDYATLAQNIAAGFKIEHGGAGGIAFVISDPAATSPITFWTHNGTSMGLRGSMTVGGNFDWLGSMSVVGQTTFGSDLQIRTDNSTASPGMPWMRSDGASLVINATGAGAIYLSWDLPTPVNTGGSLSVGTTFSIAGGTSITSSTNIARRNEVNNFSANQGIGGTPNAGWSSGFAVYQFGNEASIAAENVTASTNTILVTQNGYWDGSAWKFIRSGFASNYYQSAGDHFWRSSTASGAGAGSALTWTTVMSLSEIGNLFIAGTNLTSLTGLTITPTNALTLAGTSIVLNPSSSYIDYRDDARTDHWVGQLTGWKLTYAGALDLRNLYTDELHARRFIVDEMLALMGGQFITKSQALLHETLICPSTAGGSTSLTVEDRPGMLGVRLFANGDYVSAQLFSWTDGDADGNTEFVTGFCIGSVVLDTSFGASGFCNAGNGCNPGGQAHQRYTFTRPAGANGGGLATSTPIPAKQLVLDMGVAGQRIMEATVNAGAEGVDGGYWRGWVWATSPAVGNRTIQWQLGNLNNVGPGTWGNGLFAGVYNTQHIVASNTLVELYNVSLLLSGTAGAIKIGATPPASCVSGTGIYINYQNLCGVLSSVTQFKIDPATGEAVAGAGKVKLNVGGIVVDATSSTVTTDGSYKFTFGAGTGGLYAFTSGGGTFPWLQLSSYQASTGEARTYVQAKNDSSLVELVTRVWSGGGDADLNAPTSIDIQSPLVGIHASTSLKISALGDGTLSITGGNGTVTSSSDARLKDIIGPLPYGLKEVLALQAEIWHWNKLSGIPANGTYGGFTAQAAIKAGLKLAVSTDRKGMYSLDMNVITGSVVNAIHELHAFDRTTTTQFLAVRREAEDTRLELQKQIDLLRVELKALRTTRPASITRRKQ